MSSQPQHLYPSDHPSPLSFATAQPLPAYSSAPDYGPFGSVPNQPGVVYFGEKWGARKGPIVFIILGSIFTVFGLLALAGGAIAAALGVLVVGVSFVGIGFYNRKNRVHLELLCDAGGVTVRRANREQGALPSVWVPWTAVSATRCTVRRIESQSTENGNTTTFIQEFSIDAGGSSAFQTDEKTTKGLTAFIDLCNRSAPHLGYRWIPKKAARGLPVIETVYKYAKVPLP